MARSSWGDQPAEECPWVVIGYKGGEVRLWGIPYASEVDASRQIDKSKDAWLRLCERLSIFNAKTGQVIQVDRSAWPKL